MKQVFPLIKEEDPPSKKETVFIRILVWLADTYNTVFYRTHVPVFDFLCSVYMYRKLRWIIRLPAYFCILVLIGVSILTPLMVREMVISVAPWTYVRTAKAAEPSEDQIAKMTTEEYIAYKFGKDARMALAIASAEGLHHPCDGWNPNSNKSIDVGVFRVNSVHFKKAGVSISTMADCKKNVDFAKQLFDQQGWVPWSSYQNGSYKKFLN